MELIDNGSVVRDFNLWSKGVLPFLRALHQIGYLRVEAQGLEKIPNQPYVMVGNHGGWAAIDGLVVPLAMSERVPVTQFPWAIVADLLWKIPYLGEKIRLLGSVQVSVVRDPAKVPAYVGNIGIFPEGAEGNCKPWWEAYQMHPWKTGFARLAYARKALVMPIAVIGLEECLPVLWKLRALEPLIGTILPIPMVPFPLPTRCKIVFCDPIDICAISPGPEEDPTFFSRIAQTCQTAVQQVIDRETEDRPLARLARHLRKRRDRDASVGMGEASPHGPERKPQPLQPAIQSETHAAPPDPGALDWDFADGQDLDARPLRH